jgi:hypothetical protein
MKFINSPRLLQAACASALAALALFVWSLLDPRPIPVILAMSLGQVLGTLSFAAFLLVVAYDLRGGRRKNTEIPKAEEQTKPG